MKNMIILLDMDNVVAALIQKWLFVYNSEFNDNLTLVEIKTWDAEFYAKKCGPKEFHSIIERPYFFADLKVLPGSIEITKKLKDAGHEIYFVTATPYNNLTAGYDKGKWIECHFPHIGRSNMIQTHDKFMIRGDILLDDSPINLKAFPGISVAMNYAYNQDAQVDYRVNDFFEFGQLIEKIGLDK